MINEIDPRIYNFKNLKLEDQVVVASQFKIFLLVKKEKEDLKETADKQNSLTKFLYEVAIEELDEVEEKIKKIQEELPGDAFSQVTFCTSQTTYLEFFNSQVSKAKAMERLGQLFNIRQEEMIAVGDGLNDLPMIEYAGLGVAMENAQAQVKTRARYITSSNEEDGVGKVLEKFVLI